MFLFLIKHKGIVHNKRVTIEERRNIVYNIKEVLLESWNKS